MIERFHELRFSHLARNRRVSPTRPNSWTSPAADDTNKPCDTLLAFIRPMKTPLALFSPLLETPARARSIQRPIPRLILVCAALIPTMAQAQQAQTFDLLEFRTPAAQRETFPEAIQFTKISGRSFCRFAIYHSVASAGDTAADYQKEWTQLTGARQANTPLPNPISQTSVNGWTRIESAADEQTNNIGRYRVRHVTFTGGGRRMSAVVYYNDESLCQPNPNSFLENLRPISPVAPQNKTAQTPQPPSPQPPPSNSKSGFAFITTNFDDGWTATEQPDWVQVTRGNVTVLIHYARPDIRDIPNVDAQTSFVWNQLVAPRYSNAANVWLRKSWWEDGFTSQHFGEADLTDRASGRRVHVALHRGGNGRAWLEFVTPDKATFEREFGKINEQGGTNWDRLTSMASRNKFAVAASDLPGVWAGSSGAGIEYVNAYTGNSLGMSAVSISNQFTFEPGGTYSSVYKGVDSAGGANRYYGANYKGNYSVDRWQMTLTNRFKGETHKFAIQFEAVKGGRILHMYRGEIEDIHLFRQK
jgi:hypothetical protein